ncbi:phage tail spike protein [Clostridium sp.]|uniref:phage tail spike protein n=1 Tax=Clostridium sp. TaxID=1506 RepID=UPI00262B8E9B|nr:phage tail spike protein [Clostridium sp.]
MNKDIKIALFDKNTPKSKVLKNVGDFVLDNICVKSETNEENGIYELDAIFLVDDDGVWRSVQEEAILKVKLDYGYEEFRIVNIIKNKWNITVFARQITIQDQLATQLKDVRSINQNGHSCLQWMLKNSNEYIENRNYARDLEFSSDIDTISTAYYQDKNLYEALFDCDQSFINRWGGEIQRRGYITIINKRIGEDRGFQVRRGKNLTSFEAETNMDNVVTRIKPVAYNGHTIDGYVQSGNIDKYARVKTITIKYDDVKLQEDCEEGEVGYATLEELQAELIRRATLEFTEKHVDELQAKYRIDFVGLAKTEEYKKYAMLERVYIGDTVNVYEEKLDINVKVRVISKRYDVLRQKVIEMQLSNIDLSKFKPTSIVEIIKEINKLPESFENVLSKAKKEATDLINAGINGFVVVNKNEILIMDTADKNTATKVWRWNINGLGHSLTGYNGEYNTALTMDGKLVLNELTCEGINAMLINAGILKSLNGESWINLDSGEAQLIGTVKSQNGDQFVSMGSGGITFQDWRKKEQMLRMGISYFDANRDLNGITFAMPLYADFIRFSHIAKEDLTQGWTSGDKQYNFFDCWSSDQTFDGNSYKKGINMYAPLWINNNINITSNDSNSPHQVYNTTEGKLLLCGDNGILLGYRKGTQNLIRLYINESDDSSGCAINAYGNWNFNSGAIKNANIVNTYANTETRTVAEVSTLETNSTDNIRYIYKDINSKDNRIVLNIPNEYQGRSYTIVGIAKKGFGDYAITEESKNRFIIETDREMTMNIEISIN